MRMTASQLNAMQAEPKARRRDLEGPIHRAVLNYLRVALPGAVIHHSPNETDLSGRDVARAIAKQKALGMVPGFPDLIVFWRGYAWAIEIKASGNGPTRAQKQVGADLARNGVRWSVVRSVDDVKACVQAWGVT